MPVNEGVILAAGANVAAKFFAATSGLYEFLWKAPSVKDRYDFDIRRWRGGQLSLGALVKWHTPPHAPDHQTIGGLKYKFLPCEEYNYTVNKGDSPDILRSKWALHFKGNRKHLISSK
jgi:hypothetical protein